ncbi:MAG: hypothetical protein IKR34_07835, partial [Candidatus Gastranaerophilales bacterium]|nr:hypothetical protein [Candidatus Gastranaerophilales bacterium]
MGCLKSLIHKIIFIALVVAFFMLGGWAFVNGLIKNYQNPARNEFVEKETNFADFTDVPSDYQLTRSFNFFGYKKINAKYLPTEQKITIYDLKNEERIKVSDFNDKTIDKKIDDILNNFKDSIVTFENFEIVERNNYKAQGKTIPYIRFKAKVKNIPFKNVTGIISAYSTVNNRAKNPSTKLIFTIVDSKAYNPKIVSDFVNA